MVKLDRFMNQTTDLSGVHLSATSVRSSINASSLSAGLGLDTLERVINSLVLDLQWKTDNIAV